MEQDINNLIEELKNARPDELSTEGLKLFNKINEIIDKNKELEEENEVWKNSYYEQKEFNNKQVLYITEKFIPVSLVEETIKIKKEYKLKYEQEFADNKDENYFFDINAIDKEIQVLQELLEKRK